MKTERVHTHSKSQSSINSWDKIGEDDEFYYLIPPESVVKVAKDSVYFKKKEAQYELFKHRILHNSTTVWNFKSSKYYDYYIERATKENPELLI